MLSHPGQFTQIRGTFYCLMSCVLGEGHMTLRSLSWLDAGRVSTPPDLGGENGICRKTVTMNHIKESYKAFEMSF